MIGDSGAEGGQGTLAIAEGETGVAGSGTTGRSLKPMEGWSGASASTGWQKVYRMAQRFGSTTVIITVLKREDLYKLSAYEPESSALYELSFITANATTPYKVLLDHCDLAGKVDLVICMHEISFPHQVTVSVIHLPTSQEFNLKLGDDYVYAMIENSRKEASFDHTEGVVPVVRFNTQSQRTENLRIPVIRTQLDFKGRRGNTPLQGITMQLLYQAETTLYEDAGLIFRVHKRTATNDVAVTLRMRGNGPLSLPPVPNTGVGGRVLDTTLLGAGEGRANRLTEYTVWLQDKCSRAPCGAFGEVCDVPGLGKPVLLLISDDDAPRAIRVAVCMASLPFTILFQVVLLEVSEVSAVVQSSSRVSASRRSLNQVFVRYFGGRTPTSGILSQMASSQVTHGERALGDEKEEVRRKLDELTPAEDVTKKLGVQYGDGPGGPGTAREGETESSVIHMTTRKK